MTNTPVMTEEYKVLLIWGEKIDVIDLLILPQRSEKLIPQGHEKCIISLKVSVMPQVEFWSVEKILEWRKLMVKYFALNADIHVTICIHHIKKDQI